MGHTRSPRGPLSDARKSQAADTPILHRDTPILHRRPPIRRCPSQRSPVLGDRKTTHAERNLGRCERSRRVSCSVPGCVYRQNDDCRRRGGRNAVLDGNRRRPGPCTFSSSPRIADPRGHRTAGHLSSVEAKSYLKLVPWGGRFSLSTVLGRIRTFRASLPSTENPGDGQRGTNRWAGPAGVCGQLDSSHRACRQLRRRPHTRDLSAGGV